MLNGLDFAFGPSREIVVARDHATVYVCTNYVCKLPTSDVAKLKALMMQ